MGAWWKTVRAAVPTDRERRVSFEGDPKAPSKGWWIIWRYCQNRHIIRIEREGQYRFFFHSEGQVMQFRKWLFSEYVAVRIGPKPVTFWAEDERGKALLIHDMSIMIPGLFRKDPRGAERKQWAKDFSSRAEFI
jgi:hypothetical protein